MREREERSGMSMNQKLWHSAETDLYNTFLLHHLVT